MRYVITHRKFRGADFVGFRPECRGLSGKGLACGHTIRRDCPPADDYAVHALASPHQDGRSRAFTFLFDSRNVNVAGLGAT